MFSDKELRVLDVLYFEAIVPKDGLFQITEKHLKEFVSLSKRGKPRNSRAAAMSFMAGMYSARVHIQS